jgi:serine/threonine-protein kinase RsbT
VNHITLNKPGVTTDFSPSGLNHNMLFQMVITEEIHVAVIRQAAIGMAQFAGFKRSSVFSVGTAVTELATNLILHTNHGGEIFLSLLEVEDCVGLEVVCRDQGPGIADLYKAMQDGYSTKRGLGGGLPGVKRLMDEFNMESEIGTGTRIVARKWD